MNIDEGSHIHSIRIFHFLGALHEYTSLTVEQIFNLAKIAREREGTTTKYDLTVEETLRQIARMLS